MPGERASGIGARPAARPLPPTVTHLRHERPAEADRGAALPPVVSGRQPVRGAVPPAEAEIILDDDTGLAPPVGTVAPAPAADVDAYQPDLAAIGVPSEDSSFDDAGFESGAERPAAVALPPEPSRTERVAERLEALARDLRAEGGRALRHRMEHGSRFEAVIAAVLAGYLSAGEGH